MKVLSVKRSILIKGEKEVKDLFDYVIQTP
jgi:hypothetical protein